MTFKITVAIDNSVPIGARAPFLAEHGLSMLLETGGERLLLDTGQSTAILHNLGLLGVAPSSLDLIAISHGHYDHTGGLYPILQHAAKSIPVYLHPDAFQARFSVSHGQRKFVGIPYPQDLLTALGADWQWVREPLELREGVWLSGAVPRTTDFETGDARLVLGAADATGVAQDAVRDELRDDMAFFVASEQGLVVVSGCTHSGLVNMVRYGLQVTGCTRLHGWIGGTHLGPVGKPQQDETIATLQRYAPDFVAANHCTGFAMMARLQQVFGERFIAAGTGTVITF